MTEFKIELNDRDANYALWSRIAHRVMASGHDVRYETIGHQAADMFGFTLIDIERHGLFPISVTLGFDSPEHLTLFLLTWS